MNVRAHIVLLAAALSLGACSSQSTHYYTLIAPQDAASAAVAQPLFQFNMLPVSIPVQVDQPQVVLRDGDGSLAILESELWGGPLGDEFHDALTGQLERRFGVRDLAGLPRQSDQPVLSVRTDVRRFESVLNQYALIDVVWNLSLSSRDNKRRNLTCSSVIREPAGAGVKNLVLAHQRAVANLADAIAKTADDWTREPVSRCWSGAQ
ncbi:PqiC family protein [Pseudomonas sp. Ant30-3]|uniref:PqiC family protein n=1 Tax=Pseudomonas sp. Ant30-3 TaxID=1488328 RepID=UPI0004910C39|nr:PqiC family protein [Pseudomonas sp. Ant30-3]